MSKRESEVSVSELQDSQQDAKRPRIDTSFEDVSPAVNASVEDANTSPVMGNNERALRLIAWLADALNAIVCNRDQHFSVIAQRLLATLRGCMMRLAKEWLQRSYFGGHK